MTPPPSVAPPAGPVCERPEQRPAGDSQPDLLRCRCELFDRYGSLGLPPGAGQRSLSAPAGSAHQPQPQHRCSETGSNPAEDELSSTRAVGLSADWLHDLIPRRAADDRLRGFMFQYASGHHDSDDATAATEHSHHALDGCEEMCSGEIHLTCFKCFFVVFFCRASAARGGRSHKPSSLLSPALRLSQRFPVQDGVHDPRHHRAEGQRR